MFASAARADAVDDTLAKFLDDKFPQTEAAIGELAAEAPPRPRAILEALGDNRLLIDPADHLVAYKTAAGALLNAKTGEPIAERRRRGLQEGARQQRAEARHRRRDGLAHPRQSRTFEARRSGRSGVQVSRRQGVAGRQAERAKETDARAADALKLGEASIGRRATPLRPRTVSPRSKPSKPEATRTPRASSMRSPQKRRIRRSRAPPQPRSASIQTRLAIWGVAQNLWYGVSASSVLLLAAIGLAITFGVMGVINMAHGEMVMLGAYSTYVVQSLLPPSLQNWSLAFAIPLAFVVAASSASRSSVW